MGILKIGDKVMYRGGFGTQAPVEVVVDGIVLNPGGIYHTGDRVKSCDWAYCENRSVIVTLSNGYWGYGYQIKPVSA